MTRLQRLVSPIARRLGFVPRPSQRSSAFAAAQISRLTSSWTNDPGAVNRWIRWELRTLRARARQQVRSDSYGRAWGLAVEQNAAGPSPFELRGRVRTRRGDKLDILTNKRIEPAYRDFSRAAVCDVTGKLSLQAMHRLNLRTWASDGEILMRLYPGEGPHGFQCQILDVERLDIEKNERYSDGRSIKMGVEMDVYGRPLAYYILRQHPGEYGLFGQGTTRDSERVPADQIIHAFVPEWPEQARGIPPLAASMMRMWHMGEFEQAAVINARVGASKIAAISIGQGDEGTLADGKDSVGNYLSDSGPAEYWVIPEGAELHEWNPQFPDAAIEPFVRAMLRGTAAGLGVAYHAFANDPSNVNYSTARVALLQERDMWMTLQQWYVEQVVERLYEAWLLYAPLTGVIPSEWTADRRLRSVRWRVKRWQWVDPLKEAQAQSEAIDARLTSRTRLADEAGEEFEDILEEISEEQKLAASLGVELTPAKPAATAPSASAPADSDEEDPEDDSTGQ